MAGIIVGYLPIFFIDEVWSLAAQSWRTLVAIVALLGFATLLYLYIEVQRGSATAAWLPARAPDLPARRCSRRPASGCCSRHDRALHGARAWPGGGQTCRSSAARAAARPFIGQLPLVLGIAPYYAFPSAVFMMTFMSFFIGTFLQLMWEDIPITEPL
jgi:hypothetical protein